jgi:hypothetical protein
MKMEMQQMMERLLTKMEATQERIEANTKSMREDIKSGQEEIRSIVDACMTDMNDRKQTMYCQETTEANTEKTEPHPGTMQYMEEHQEIPKEEATVMPVRGLRKRHRDRNLATGRRQKPKRGSRQTVNPGGD